MKLYSVSRHLKGSFCPIATAYSPERRSELYDIFLKMKTRKRAVTKSHQLSAEEQVALSIIDLLGWKSKPKLSWLCRLQDGQTAWIENTLLSLSTVGNRWMKKGQRWRKAGKINQINPEGEMVSPTVAMNSASNPSKKRFLLHPFIFVTASVPATSTTLAASILANNNFVRSISAQGNKCSSFIY